MRFLRLSGGLIAAMTFALFAGTALAAPDEIQVYTEEMNDTGEFGLELHVNYAIKGARESTYEGEMPGHHMLQMTPEFSYGVSKSWEAGLYLPFALNPDGNLYNNGLRLRMKYMAPREDNEKIFWGLNTEMGYSTRRVSDSYWGMELRPIIGYRDDAWLLSFNPILNLSLSDNGSHAPQFEPSLKITHAVAEGFHAGVEYYGEFGPLHQILPADERSHSMYAVMDVAKGDLDVNFGLGRGFGANPDKWVAKAIIAFPLR